MVKMKLPSLILKKLKTVNSLSNISTGIRLFLMSKVQCMSWFEICISEGKGGEKGGNANFKSEHTEPLR